MDIVSNKDDAIRLKFYQIIDKPMNKDFKGFKERDYEALKEIKQYIIEHPDNYVTKEIYSVLAEYLKEKTINIDFLNALSMDDTLKYKKKHEIFKHLPLIDKCDMDLFTNLVPNQEYYGNIVSYYRACFDFFKKQHKLIFSNYEEEYILKFVQDNQASVLNQNTSYKTMEEEIEDCRKIAKGIVTDEYQIYKMDRFGKGPKSNALKAKYLDKKINDVAELYIYDCIKNLDNATFVSRDISEGFGYDMYYTINEGETKEILLNVKSTNDMNKDNFTLTDTEFKAMCESLINPRSRYIICFSHVNFTNDFEIRNYLLEAKDMFTLVDIDSKQEYRVNFHEHEKTYKAQPKEKIIIK